MLEKLYDNVYRICIPFEDLYTTSFVFIKDSECIIADSGTTEYDVRMYIIPEIERMGLKPVYLVYSHTHSDHVGGMPALVNEYPEAKEILFAKGGTVSDGDIIFDRYKLLNLKGHSEDSLAIHDVKENVLFSFDCLQLRGIGKYRHGIADFKAYKASVERLRTLRLSQIIASHDYDPYGYCATGDFEVNRYLDECLNSMQGHK